MAVNFLNLPQDWIHETALKRKFAKSFIGEFTLGYELGHHRARSFLPRNMTRVLAFHEKKHNQRDDYGGQDNITSPARLRGLYLGNPVVNGRSGPNEISSNSASSGGVQADLLNDYATNHCEHDTSKPDVESMSTSCLKVKRQNDTFDNPQRRSQRAQLIKQHEDKDAQLLFDITNIRKKLNFKENNPSNENHPRKRVKREGIHCHCSITIWDNRQGCEQILPIMKKTEDCHVTKVETDSGGHFINVKLEKPFLIPSSELRVKVNDRNGTALRMGDKYFLELKIMPARDDVAWPPIPILGKSEGDQLNGLAPLVAEELQGSLVARYLHLPHAPESDVPLAVFFLQEGRTHRTKYGMEVNATWIKGEPKIGIKTELVNDTLKSWEVDDEYRPYGRQSSKTVTAAIQPALIAAAPKPKITFVNDPLSAAGTPKDFRRANLYGYQCPSCPKLSFAGLQELQFHFQTFHSKYNFKLDKEIRDESTGELTAAVFKMTPITISKPRNQDRDAPKEPRTFSWCAPSQPFNVSAYVKGDQSWTGDQTKKKGTATTTLFNITPDPLTALRQARGGFLFAEDVPEFRKATRRKYPNIKLNTMTEDASVMYTSVSHRQVQQNEEPRSESDDEMDDEWFVQKSLEALDVEADRYEWAEEDRILRKKWNNARLAEKLSHPRYLSDSLIRFVRDEREWLASGNMKVRRALAKFLDELQQRQVIVHQVVRDIWCIIHSNQALANPGDPDVKMLDTLLSAQRPVNKPPTSQEAKIEALLALPDFSCGICKEVVESFARRLHCSELDCEVPGVWYHTKCARCKTRDKLNWKCPICTDKSLEKDEKGKGRA